MASAEHPSNDDLRALSLGQLAEAELARVSAHLGECPDCCRRIDDLAAADPLLSRLQAASRPEEPLITPIQRRSAVRALRHARDGKAAAPGENEQARFDDIPAPKQVGAYEILAEVGRGGMGVVYKARDQRLQRLVALKMVLASEFLSAGQALRFRLEAELAARVQHPNIVQVYEAGSYEGRPFLAMEWVDGCSLGDKVGGNPWPAHRAARLVETLARAMQAAHEQGVVHRDLKPANILLKDECRTKDEKQAAKDDWDPSSSSLVPKIADFGLAQPIEGGKTLTQSGYLVGTPGYMAPEQATGKRALVGPATDIYALGVLLYQLTTGQLPFEGDSTLEVLRAVAENEVVRPRRLQPDLPHDLEAITLHCLEKQPGRRYASAQALADDLVSFQGGKPITARPVGAAARVVRWCRRKPLVAGLLALVALSLLGGLLGVTWEWREANQQRDLANSHAQQASAEKQAALRQAYRASLAAAAAAIQNHDVANAGQRLDDVSPSLRDWEWRHLRSRLDDRSRRIVAEPGESLSLVRRPDGIHVGRLSRAGLHLTDLDGLEPRSIPFSTEPNRSPQVLYTAAGLRLVDWPGDQELRIRDESGKVRLRLPLPEGTSPCNVRLSPDGSRLAVPRTTSDSIAFVLYKTTTGKQLAECAGHKDALWALAFSPDGTWIASAGEDGAARIWDSQTGALVAECRGHTSKVLSVAYRPDGARLVSTSADGTVRQWDPATGKQVEPPYDQHTGEVLSAAYSPDGDWIVSGGTDRTVRVWRAMGRLEAAVLHGHTGAVTEVAFTPDGRRLASVSQERVIGWAGDNTVGVWEVDARATLPVLRGHTSYVYPVVFSPDGRWIASGGWDNTLRLWDAATGEPCATFPTTGIVRCLAYGADGRWLVTGGDGDDRLCIWDVATARVRRTIKCAGISCRSLAVSPDGDRVAVTTSDSEGKCRLGIFDPKSGEALFSADGCALAYSADGRWLASLDADSKTVLLRDARTHQVEVRLPGHTAWVNSAAFSRNSRLLATCSSDRTVRVWSIDSGACQELRGHSDEVFAMAFHPDGTRLATAGRDRAIWLWDLSRGEEVARLQGHASYVWSLAFSPDGKTLVSGSGDSTLRLWDTEPLAVRYQARREAEALRPEAERLVERLFRELKDAPQVVAALRADPSLSEAQKHAGFRAVLRPLAQGDEKSSTIPK
jgi:WD40 repeat protein/serine/threonine protein kinase